MSLTGIAEVADLATTVVNKIWPDKSAAEQAQLAQQFAIIQGQIDTNKAEAASTNWFVAGWRPFVGWICGTGLGYQFLVYPIAIAWFPKIVQLDMGTLMTLLGGMLGFGAMRMNEKISGVAR